MDEIEKRLKRDTASIERVNSDRERLTAEGSYPAKFRFPLAMQFEITSKCNLRCKHCYNRSGENKSIDAVTGDDWIAFAKKLVAKGGLFEATISGGEPLLLGDKLFELMDVLHEDGTCFNLVSNGYLFDKKILERLKKYRFYERLFCYQIEFLLCLKRYTPAPKRRLGMWNEECGMPSIASR